MTLAFPIALLKTSSAVWAPTTLSTDLLGWWDTQDASSITHSSGAVSQWNDKSGNSKHLTQATAGAKPAYSATGMDGSRPAISSVDIDRYLDNASFTIGSSSLTVVIVVYIETTNTVNSRRICVWFNGTNDFSGTTNGVIPLLSHASSNVGGYWNSADRGQGTASFGAKHWFISEWNGSTGNNTIYVDGSAGTPAAWSSSNTFAGAGTLRLFNYSGLAFGCICRIGEVFAVKRVLTAGERTSVAGYVARWGL